MPPTPHAMNVEVALCTRNRAALLTRTLERLSRIQTPTDAAVRLILVDNSSTDTTPAVIDAYSQRLEMLRLVEPQPGHVAARNAAIAVASGELLLWLDDDVLVSDRWLEEYVAAARRQSDVSFWGGKITARFDHRQPRWIDRHWETLKGCYAVRELGSVEFDFSKERLPYGANFAIRTSVQKQFPFDHQFGRSGQAVVGEDELSLFRTLLDRGHTGRWLPDAAVDHLIDASRTSTAYIGRYFVGQGQALVGRNEAWTTDTDSLRREAAHELFWFRAKRFSCRSNVWLSHLIRGSLAKGQLQALEMAFNDPPANQPKA